MNGSPTLELPPKMSHEEETAFAYYTRVLDSLICNAPGLIFCGLSLPFMTLLPSFKPTYWFTMIAVMSIMPFSTLAMAITRKENRALFFETSCYALRHRYPNVFYRALTNCLAQYTLWLTYGLLLGVFLSLAIVLGLSLIHI